jgi:hypothetical protein
VPIIKSAGVLHSVSELKGGAFVSDLFIRSPMTSWVFLRQLSRELVAQCLRQVEFGKLPTPL